MTNLNLGTPTPKYSVGDLVYHEIMTQDEEANKRFYDRYSYNGVCISTSTPNFWRTTRNYGTIIDRRFNRAKFSFEYRLRFEPPTCYKEDEWVLERCVPIR